MDVGYRRPPRSPYSATRTRRVVNAIAAEVMLRLSYGELTDSALRKMPSLPGVENVSSLQKKMPDGSTRVLEFGIANAANGGQTIQITGRQSPALCPVRILILPNMQQRVQASLQERNRYSRPPHRCSAATSVITSIN